MKTTACITLNDLVFENRNHAYGAYYLRKNYTKFASTALLITLSIILLSFTSHTVYKKYFGNHADFVVDSKVNISGVLDVINIVPEERIIIEEPRIEQLERQLAFTTPVVSANVTEEVATITELMNSQSGLINVETGLDPGSIVNTTVQNTVEIIDDVIHLAVEVPAEFPGGEQALYKSVYKNLVYPEESRANEVQGKVIIQFVVGKDGSVSNAKILKSTVDELCEQEAIKAVTLLPRWKPAENNGNICAQYFTIPIEFQIRK